MGDSEDDFELPDPAYTPISSLEHFQHPKLKPTVNAKKQQKPANKKLTNPKKILDTKQNCYQIPENNFLVRKEVIFCLMNAFNDMIILINIREYV